MITPQETINEAVALEGAAVRRSLDVLFRGLDEFLCNDGQIDPASLDITKMGTFLLIGLLSFLVFWKDRLGPDGWSIISGRVRERLQILAPDRVERLMQGFA